MIVRRKTLTNALAAAALMAESDRTRLTRMHLAAVADAAEWQQRAETGESEAVRQAGLVQAARRDLDAARSVIIAAIEAVPRKACQHNSAGTPRASCPDCARSKALDEAEAAALGAGGAPCT